jgi:hypothetical protein
VTDRYLEADLNNILNNISGIPLDIFGERQLKRIQGGTEPGVSYLRMPPDEEWHQKFHAPEGCAVDAISGSIFDRSLNNSLERS